MVLRAPVYLTEPSFWAEEGTLYFAMAWDRPLGEALTYRSAGYLLLWANLATVLAAGLVRAGLLPLAHAPQVTALFALAAQLLPVAIIAWSRAPFWDGTLRRAAGVGVLLLGVLTDEVWLNTVNSQPWFVVAAALLLLEPAGGGRARVAAGAAALAVAGLSAPATSALAPLFAWRAWRTRAPSALVHGAVATTATALQVWCVWLALQGGQRMPARAAAVDIGAFAAALWMRMLLVPLAGVETAKEVGRLVVQRGGVGPLAGAVLLLLAAALLTWLVRGLRPAERMPLAGAYVLVTALSLQTAIGGPGMLLHSPWTSSRYAYAPGVLLLLIVLGCIRRDAGRVRAVLCALCLAAGLARGARDYPSSVRWTPSWPRWPDEVRAWQAAPARPLEIWPPPWTVGLRPLAPRAAPASPDPR